MGKARGGGCNWEALIDVLFKGPELLKVVILVSAAAFVAMFNNKEEPLPDYCSAITFLLAIAVLLTFISYFVFHNPNFPYGPKVAVIIGLISSAFMIVTIPIFSTYLLPTHYAILTWACYVLLVLVVCCGYLLPFSFPDLLLFWKNSISGSTKEEGTTPEEREMSSPGYQSGEFSSSEVAENGHLEAVIVVTDQPGLDPDMVIPTQIINSSTPTVLQNEISSASCSTKVIKLSSEDVEEDIVQVRKPAVVCFVLGANPPLKVMNGFFRRVWGKYGIDNVSMLPNGILVVEFFTYSQALKAAEGRQLMFDGKPVITKLWEHDLILKKEEMIPATVPVWIQLPGLELKYWKPSCINKLAGLVGKPLKIEFTRVLVEVNVNHQLPDWVYFVDEAGFWRKQKVHYVWKPVFCESCNNFGHGSADCRKRSGAPKKMWVVKSSDPVALVAPNITGEVHSESVIKTVDKGKAIWVGS